MQNNDAQEFLNQLKTALEAEKTRYGISSHLSAFPGLLDEVATTLEKHGLSRRDVHAALLALCGVPINPLNIY